jgi:hypothetical protein
VVDRDVVFTGRGAARWLGSRRARSLGLGCLGAILVGPPGCGTELSEDDLHEALVGWFRREGVAVDEARCPHALPREQQASLDCRVIVGREEVEVTVTVTDDDGALSIRPRHATVVAARAEPEIAETLRAQGYGVAEVRCEDRVWVARPGAEQRCKVVDDQGRRFAWIGVWTGEGTHQRTRVVPMSSGDGGAR